MTWLSDRERVVVPLDHSEPSYRALATARELVGPERLRAIHVHPPVSLTLLDYTPPEAFGDAAQMAASRALIAAQMEARGAGDVALEVRIGPPAPVICAYVAEIDADLVVISTHGRSGLKRVLMGSVAEHVIRHAACPVLVLRRDAPPG